MEKPNSIDLTDPAVQKALQAFQGDEMPGSLPQGTITPEAVQNNQEGLQTLSLHTNLYFVAEDTQVGVEHIYTNRWTDKDENLPFDRTYKYESGQRFHPGYLEGTPIQGIFIEHKGNKEQDLHLLYKKTPTGLCIPAGGSLFFNTIGTPDDYSLYWRESDIKKVKIRVILIPKVEADGEA